MATPRETGRETLLRGRALEFHRIGWEGADGVVRLWESAERVGGRPAVLLIPWLKPSDRLLLVRQYRPPARDFVIEFPAGLTDAGESPETAALRELREETGYAGRILRVLPPMFSSPGLSSEAVHQIVVEIDETAPENNPPRPCPDAGESIETIAVPRAELAAFFRGECGKGVRFDAKVAAYLLGLETAAM